MTAVPHPEPTIADVLARLHIMETDNRSREAALAEMRLDMATRLSSLGLGIDNVNTRLTGTNTAIEMVLNLCHAMRMRLDTLFDELAAFRAEYNQHTHDDQ